MKLTTEDRKALQGAVRVLVEILQRVSPEVPERVEEWPEDDTHLQGEFWEDADGDVWKWVPSESMWQVWSHEYNAWAGGTSSLAWMSCTFTRTTDPSLPRTWDTLDDVPEDVERVTGDYVGMRRELARSPLSESGWFQRIKDNAPRKWTELPETETNNVTNIKETP